MVEVDLSKGYWKLGVATYSSEIFHRLALNLKKTPTLSPGQTIATLLGATCCARLATLLCSVATCWVLLAQIWPSSNTWTNISLHGATWRPNARDMLRNNVAICCVSMKYFYHLTSPFNWIRQSTQWNKQVVKNSHWFIISNMKDGVWPRFQTPRRDLKIRRVAKYFWRTSRFLEMWSNTVWSVWYIFLIGT